MTEWETEEIPNDAILYFRVHVNFGPDRQWPHVPLGAIKNTPNESPSMSTDWDKYAAPYDTVQPPAVAGRPPRNPENYRVAKFHVGGVREVPKQTVVHTPDLVNKNRAHTDIFGPKEDRDPEMDEEYRVMLARRGSLLTWSESHAPLGLTKPESAN